MMCLLRRQLGNGDPATPTNYKSEIRNLRRQVYEASVFWDWSLEYGIEEVDPITDFLVGLNI